MAPNVCTGSLLPRRYVRGAAALPQKAAAPGVFIVRQGPVQAFGGHIHRVQGVRALRFEARGWSFFPLERA
jgi:hypothetical protein